MVYSLNDIFNIIGLHVLGGVAVYRRPYKRPAVPTSQVSSSVCPSVGNERVFCGKRLGRLK